jgi:hypothetical protein
MYVCIHIHIHTQTLVESVSHASLIFVLLVGLKLHINFINVVLSGRRSTANSLDCKSMTTFLHNDHKPLN